MDAGYTYELQEPFVEMGSISLSQTAPAVGSRDAVTMEALSNSIHYVIDDGVPCLDFRFRSNDANNSNIALNFYERRDKRNGRDYYRLAFTVTVKVGLQVADTGFTFSDYLTLSNDYTDQEIKATAQGGDSIANLFYNTRGNSHLVVVATSLTANKTVDIDVAKLHTRYNVLKA